MTHCCHRELVASTSLSTGSRRSRACRGPAALALALTACSPTSHHTILRELQTQLSQQYHECVPLGWSPVPVADSYVPGYSAILQDESSWIKPLWLGSIHTTELRRPEVRTTYDVLRHLARAGMVKQTAVPGGFHYRLTVKAMPYFFDGSALGNNPDRIPYLCYSTIVANDVVWNEPVHSEWVRDHRLNVFRAGFTWSPSAVAPWANDPLLRSHSVIFGPVRSPAVAKFVNRNEAWQIENLYAPEPMPHLANASTWSHPR